MSGPWYVRDAHERGRLIAAFLAGHATAPTVALRAGVIARLPDCPIRPWRERQCLADAAESEELGYLDDRDYHLDAAAREVGSEPHCQRVTAALNAAVKDGLVIRTRTGRGPFRYYVPRSDADRS